MESSFGIPALLAVTLGVLLTLRHFAAPEVSLAVRLQLALSWTLSLSILALVPADVAATASGDTSARPTLALLFACLLRMGRYGIWGGCAQQDGTARVQIDFLTREYEPDFYWWEVPLMLKKLSLTGFLLLNGAVLDDEVHALAAATAKGVEISRILLEYDQGELW